MELSSAKQEFEERQADQKSFQPILLVQLCTSSSSFSIYTITAHVLNI